MSMRIDLTLTNPDAGPRVSGLSRGHVTLTGAAGTVTSAGRTPDQSMLIFVSLVDLLDGLGDFLSDPRRRDYEWVGNDSSFVVTFRRAPKGIAVEAMGEPVDEVAESELAGAVRDAASRLLAQHRPPASDIVAEDLDSALEEFEPRSRGT